jgi:hypothetical protein
MMRKFLERGPLANTLAGMLSGRRYALGIGGSQSCAETVPREERWGVGDAEQRAVPET